MNKSTIQAFAAGIIFTSALVGGYSYVFPIEKKASLTLEKAKVMWNKTDTKSNRLKLIKKRLQANHRSVILLLRLRNPGYLNKLRSLRCFLYANRGIWDDT